MDEFGAIEEEGLLDDDGARGGIPRRWYVLAFVLAFFALFAFFSLVLWGASRNQKPVVTMKVSLRARSLSLSLEIHFPFGNGSSTIWTR